MKPDVTAPGVDVLSSVPRREGLWASFSGTSMATPHVSGAAALLRQRHRGWTVDQIKSALVQTGKPVLGGAGGEIETTREGGGTIDLQRADNPLVFASPTGLSFGFVAPGASAVREVALSDAGGGAGSWDVSATLQQAANGASVSVLPTTTVPGQLVVTAAALPGAPQATHTGFVVLSRGSTTRRIPFWFRVTAPALPTEPATPLTRTGTYHGDTRGKPSLVDSYRYPEDPAPPRRRALAPRAGAGLPRRPEQAGRQLRGRRHRRGVVRRAPRRPERGREPADRQHRPSVQRESVPARVRDANPGRGRRASGSRRLRHRLRQRRPGGGGAFTFRFWIGDTTPPHLKLLSARGGRLRVRATDGGAGIDPQLVRLFVDGRRRAAHYDAAKGVVTASLRGLARRRHRFTLIVSDYQETKNMENVRRILPNTARLSRTFRVR